MSLSPAFLDDLRTRATLSSVVGRRVTWDARKSNPGKGEFWAPCPFHQEKNASFHVDDRKGFYYCFGCHAKGDVLTFLRESQNLSFIEAVRLLAAEAGIALPDADPGAARAADRRKSLTQIVELAVQHWRMVLRSQAGTAARAYLDRRGLSPEVADRWDIGFAPDDRTGILRALGAKGVAEDDVVAAGLVARPDRGGAAYDRFRGRVIFPIRGPQGRAISVGGRALDPAAPAKYLNGPQTDLFDKGRTLFNHGPARDLAAKGRPLVVAEGYVDVIALAEAGFGAVAPLGTALTEAQLTLLWKIADEPVIALDGDSAGQNAARRIVDLALPHLVAGKGLRFATLPGGLDPDDLIRTKGAAAMQALVAAAEPMVALLWRKLTEGRQFDSPERKAALDKALKEAVARIGDPNLRNHYAEDLRRLRWDFFRPRRAEAPPRNGAPFARGRGFRGAPSAPAMPIVAQSSPLAVGLDEDRLREATILSILATSPDCRTDFLAELEALECRDPDREAMRRTLLDGREIPAAALDALRSDPHVRLCPAVARPGDPVLSRLALAEGFARLTSRRRHAAAMEEAIEDFGDGADEWLTRRLSEAAAGLNPQQGRDSANLPDVVMAENGLAIDRAERDLLRSLTNRKADPPA